jgi:hypothetical protein
MRNIPYALADHTTFRLGVTSSNWREVISNFGEILLVGAQMHRQAQYAARNRALRGDRS